MTVEQLDHHRQRVASHPVRVGVARARVAFDRSEVHALRVRVGAWGALVTPRGEGSTYTCGAMSSPGAR